MITHRVTILRVAGIPIRLDASWLVIALVLTWSLATNFVRSFPLANNPGLTVGTYWGMATVASLGPFVCLILHELPAFGRRCNHDGGAGDRSGGRAARGGSGDTDHTFEV